ncbi:MAG: hypothetical protein DRQ88_00425 [Epsilonproteobacteria bacterium]|nr:MAG: hypothetical protein DRQ89_03505 [Campylobacterota bacterium]RLA68101.1 MAG: hypothetical protein DRQ88_00425 [Campylobacterota bacterium]
MALNVKRLFPLDHPEVTNQLVAYKTREVNGEDGNKYLKEEFTGPYEENEQHYISCDIFKKKLDII